MDIHNFLCLIYWEKVSAGVIGIGDRTKPYVVKGEYVSREEYRKTKVDQFITRVPKGRKVELQSHAELMGESLNSFINRAANETMGRDRDEYN